MLRQLFTATAAVALLAGCSGGDDKAGSESGDGGTQTSAPTPTAPAVSSFDPPKAFAPAAAVGQPKTPKSSQYNVKADMVGQTALYISLEGTSGRNVAGQGTPWNIPSQDAPTTTTSDATAAMPVKVDGKEVIAVAYVQRAQGTGTQKARSQVNFQWIDPAEGKTVASVILDLSAAIGPDQGGDDVVSQAYDPNTGQIAVGLSPNSEQAAKKVGNFTAYADPATKKGSVIPFVRAAGVLNGVVTGAKGTEREGSTDLAVAVADGATGKLKKTTPIPMNYLDPLATASKHAYLYGHKYVSPPPGKYDGHYVSSFYAVDLTTGAVVETKRPPQPKDVPSYSCVADQASGVACNGNDNNENIEILGFDDKTGKKAWGWTTTSANRVVPKITAAFHGLVYAQAETDAVLLNAANGQDVPSPTPTPADGATPTEGSTPSDGSSPTEGASPSDGSSPTNGPSSQGPGDTGSDLSLLSGKVKSPTTVTSYGGVYLQDPGGDDYDTETILVVLKATA